MTAAAAPRALLARKSHRQSRGVLAPGLDPFPCNNLFACLLVAKAVYHSHSCLESSDRKAHLYWAQRCERFGTADRRLGAPIPPAGSMPAVMNPLPGTQPIGGFRVLFEQITWLADPIDPWPPNSNMASTAKQVKERGSDPNGLPLQEFAAARCCASGGP